MDQKVKEMSSKTKGWGLFTSKEKKVQQQKEIDDYKEKLQQEFRARLLNQENEMDQELMKLTEELGATQLMSAEDFDKMEIGYIRFRVALTIPSVRMQLFNEFEQSIFESVVLEQIIQIEIGKGVTKVVYSILSFRVDDAWTNAQSFPTIIETKEVGKNGEILEDSDLAISHSQTHQSSKAQSLIFRLESNEAGAVSPFKITLKSEKTLFIVANFHFIKEVKRTILTALQGETLDFSFFQEAATERALQYMYAGKEFIETIKKGEYKHQALDISVSLIAPIILIPEDIFNCQRPCLIVDTGLITLESELTPFNSSVDYKEMTNPKTLYDKYEILLSNFQINILEQGLTEGLSSFKRSLGSQIIDKFDARVVLFNCLDPKHPTLPTAELSIVISNFEVSFGLDFVKSILNIQAGIMNQFDTKEDQIFEQASSEKFKELSNQAEKDFINQIRSKGKVKLGGDMPKGDTDDMYDTLLEDLDPEQFNLQQKIMRKQSYRPTLEESKQIQIVPEKQQSTNFKVYFAVEKLQLSLKDPSLKQDDYLGIMNILILHFGIAVDLDRQQNVNVNLSIYKLLIEDTQTDIDIAGPFRMILSSPINEVVRQSMSSFHEKKITGVKRPSESINFQTSVISKSILTQRDLAENEDDEFHDACSSEEDMIINEWELKLRLTKSNKIDVDFSVSDLRFIFAVPTAQKLVHISFKMKDQFEDLEVKQYEMRQQKLLMFEAALENMESVAQTADENLVRKIFRNYSRAAGIDAQISKVIYKDSIQRLYNLYDIKEKQVEKIEAKLQDQMGKMGQSYLLKHLRQKFEQIYENTIDVRSEINVKATLKNFSVWMPLNAQLDNSQVLSMQFMADLIFKQDQLSRNTYEISLNELIRKQPLESSEELAFSIKHFMVEMIKSEDYFELFNITRQSYGRMPQEKYQSSVLINPCRLSLNLHNSSDELNLIQKTALNVTVEPIEVQIGFTHVDFANMCLLQLDKTLKFVKQLTTESEARNVDFKKRQKERKQTINPQSINTKNSKQLEQDNYKRKIRPFRKGENIKTSKILIKIEIERLLISLNDDSGVVDQPLIQIRVTDTNIGLQIYDKEDDAATLILKKMGIVSLQEAEGNNDQENFMVMDAFTMLSARYFNSRSLCYEPLMENYYLMAKMNQLAPSSVKNLKVLSEKILNINLTFGVALAIRKIMDRVLESVKGAEAMRKLDSDQPISQDEVYLARDWERKMTRQNLRDERSSRVNEKTGFIFENNTGVKVQAELHDSMKTTLLKQKSIDPKAQSIAEEQIRASDLFAQTQRISLSADKISSNSKVFMSQESIMSQWKEIMTKKNKGQAQEAIDSIEQDPLKMDFEIEGLYKLEAIPIETLGVHSYRAGFQDLRLAFYKPKDSIFGKKDQPVERKIGVIFNIKMEGQIKKISIESQLLIANNLNRDVVIYVQEPGSKSYPQEFERATLAPDSVFRVPISWLLTNKQYQLVIEGKATNQVIFKSLTDLFTDLKSESKLNQQCSQIVRLEAGYHASIDVHSFTCAGTSITQQDSGPLQYLVSLNPPVMISNYNFHSLEVREMSQNGQHSEMVAAVAPKETAYVNTIDGYGNGKPNLLWIVHEDLDRQLSLLTKEFNIPDRLNEQISQEKYQNNPAQRRDLRSVKFVMETRKNYFLDIQAYQENFELRQRGDFTFTSAVQIMIYPRHMLVNKNSVAIRTGVGLQQVYVPAFSNEYFSLPKDKIQFNVPGFKNSQAIDITTVGMSGAISLDIDKQEDINLESLPQSYYPQKLELGIIIQGAPAPFKKTTLIQVVPRFLIVNQLGHPLVIKQKGCRYQVLMNNQQMPYNFEKGSQRQILIRQPANLELRHFAQNKRLYQDFSEDELQFWSQPFSIEDLEDFQISYPGQDIQDHHYDVWYMPKPENYYQRIVRVMVTTQNDATILVVLGNPAYPEYEIVNKTGMEIQFAQMQEAGYLNGLAQLKRHLSPEEMVVGKFQRLKNKVTVPYVWADRSYQNRLFGLKIGSTLKEINIDQGMQKLQIVASQVSYNVEIDVSGNAKRIKISSVNDTKEQFKKALYLQNLLKRQVLSQLNIQLELKGIGLSFIDEKPMELLYLSLYGISIDLHRWGETRSDGSGILETMSRVKLHLQHMQIDNMISNEIMPVILTPSRALKSRTKSQEEEKKSSKKSKEEEKKQSKMDRGGLIELAKEEEVPFFQLIVTLAESQDKKSHIKQRRLRAFQVQLQEFLFQLETSILNTNIKFLVELIQTFSDKNNYKVVLANAQNFEKSKYYKREDFCEALSASQSLITNKDAIQSNKMFIELIHLGAIRAIITFKVEKKAFELDVFDPQRGFGVMNLFYTLFSNVANISNSPLSFNELIITNMFVSEDILVNQVGKNYAQQAMFQWYKLVGSSDLIGNPVGLVNKLGTGVYEFVSEPAKGLLKGPDEFVGGVTKGVQSLVSNVISGGFESVSKITGSLYNVVKNVGGESKTEIKQSEHIVDGVYQGVKGGVTEIIGGVAGIFTKPIEKTKQEGAKGFFKGVGQGLFGALAAPVTATLRAGTSISQGVAGTANSIGQLGKDKEKTIDTNSAFARFRPPRYITARNVITEFDEELAQTSLIINDMFKGKYADQAIKFYCYLPETKPNGEIVDLKHNASLLVILENKLLYIKPDVDGSRKAKPVLLFKVALHKVMSCEVFMSEATQIRSGDPVYILRVSCHSLSKGVYKYSFVCQGDYAKFEKVYNLLSVLPQCEAEDKVKGTKSKANQILSQIL